MMDDLKQRLQRQANAFHPESLAATTARDAAAALDAKDAEIARMREALEPFARDADKAESLSPHNTIAHVTRLRVRDLRRARAALTAGRGD